jgi:hypothetical protein
VPWQIPYFAVPQGTATDIDSTLHHYWDHLREVLLRRHGLDLPRNSARSAGFSAATTGRGCSA